ncbi:hypothetical protein BD408DRAFT_419860 [Parasitella parasitica]|nr:hypothetical protein BD408DRAFT_419860 [Parasitella parasitica]
MTVIASSLDEINSCENFALKNNEQNADDLIDYAFKEARECALEVGNFDLIFSNYYKDIAHKSEDTIVLTGGMAHIKNNNNDLINQEVEMYDSFSIGDEDTASEFKNPGIQCSLCYESTADYEQFLHHLKITHNVQIDSEKIRHVHYQPIDQITTYCRACERECKSLERYQRHLQLVHYILPRYDCTEILETRAYPCEVCNGNHGAIKDYKDRVCKLRFLDHPSTGHSINYCVTCNITYLTRDLFRRHIDYRHKTYKPDKNPNKLPKIITPRNYCLLCQKQYETSAPYVQHLKDQHGKHLISHHDTLPDLLNFSYVCICCHLQFDTQCLLVDHYNTMLAEGFRSDEESPDPEDPGSYYKSRKKRSVEEASGMIVAPSSNIHKQHIPSIENSLGERSSTREIDINEENYCHECNSVFLSSWNYRIHVHLVHFIDMKTTKDFGNIWPDPSNPNFYCSVCKISMNSVNELQLHCRKVHQMQTKRKRKSSEIKIN